MGDQRTHFILFIKSWHFSRDSFLIVIDFLRFCLIVVLAFTDNFLRFIKRKHQSRPPTKFLMPICSAAISACRRIRTVETEKLFFLCPMTHFSRLSSKASHAMMPVRRNLLFLGIFSNISFSFFQRRMHISSTSYSLTAA